MPSITNIMKQEIIQLDILQLLKNIEDKIDYYKNRYDKLDLVNSGRISAYRDTRQLVIENISVTTTPNL